MNGRFWGAAFAAAIMLGGPAIALADVKTGVDAWAQGDYAKAVAEWRPLAQSGDMDAQFNMGQAYKLGRGVPVDFDAALDYYARAAAQGHARAEDNYGLLLFQQNRRAEAMPYIGRSAERGESRAQYLYGIALFNGDLVAKDWVRAYAMMTRAAAADLPQAVAGLGQMNQYIPDGQRQQGRALAAQMEQREDTARVAAAGGMPSPPLRQTPRALLAADLPPSTMADAAPSSRGPAAPVTGITPPAAKSKSMAAPSPAASPPKRAAGAASPSPAPASTGSWRVQLGAFSQEGRAEALWKSMSARVKTLSSHSPYLVKDNGLTRLQAGPLASKDDADKLCGEVKAAGGACMVKAM